MKFIVELDKLKKTPCERYLKHFKHGKADALKLFKELGQQYWWLYRNSEDYDIISFEIENGIFNWELYSWAVAQFCQHRFDADRYNWERYSVDVLIYCPQHFDPKRYNWEKDEWAVEMFCPHLLSLKP